MKYLLKLVYWILPEWYEPGSKRMSYILTLGWGILITFSLQIIYFSLFFVSGFKIGYMINIISFIFCVISTLILKYTKYTGLAANLVAAIIFFNTSINAYFTGGLHSSILLWITIIPIVGIFILDRKHGHFWVMGAILVLTLFYIFFPNGSPESTTIIGSDNFDIWVNLVFLTIIFWFSATVIDNAKNRAVNEVNEAKEEAHQAADKLKKFAAELEMELAQRQLAEYALRESEERLSLAIKGADMGLWDWDIQSGKMTRSEKCRELLGYSAEELQETYTHWLELIHPEDQDQVEKALFEHVNGYTSIFRSEHRVRKKNGDWIWVFASGKVTDRDNRGKATRAVGIQFDITDRKTFEEQLQNLANTDALTGLLNRRRFFELAQKEFDRAARYKLPLSVAIFDIDHFKLVNDQYGHIIGDQVLSQLANLCNESIRDIDLLARYGGEEFIILFPHTNHEDGIASAERVREAVAQTSFKIAKDSIQLTISIGVASFADEKLQNIDSLINFADKALYKSKNSGRNRTFAWGDSLGS